MKIDVPENEMQARVTETNKIQIPMTIRPIFLFPLSEYDQTAWEQSFR